MDGCQLRRGQALETPPKVRPRQLPPLAIRPALAIRQRWPSSGLPALAIRRALRQAPLDISLEMESTLAAEPPHARQSRRCLCMNMSSKCASCSFVNRQEMM